MNEKLTPKQIDTMTPKERIKLELLQSLQFAGKSIVLIYKDGMAKDDSGLFAQPVPIEDARTICEEVGLRMVLWLPDNGRDNLFNL